MLFIHHIASSIQASSIISSVAEETIAAIDRLFPENLGQGPSEDDDDQTPSPLSEWNWRAVPASQSGYSNSKSSATFVGVVVGFLNVCIIRLVASS